jgi:type II secretory pathway component PulF
MLLWITIFVVVLYIFLGHKTPRFAFISLPFVGAFLIIFAVNTEDLFALIISIFIFPVTLFSILTTPHEADVIPWPKEWARMILIIAFAILASIGFMFVSGPFGGVAVGMVGVFISSCIAAAATQRNATTAYVITTIGASMRQNLPLPMALQSAAEDLKYKHSQILRRISKWLVQGYSLSESMKRGFRNCPAKITALIAVGEKTNQLPQVVQSIENDLLEKAYDSKRIRPVYPGAYFITVIIILSAIVLGLMIGVIPKFSSVLHDFGRTDLPKSTKFLIRLSNAIAFEYGWVTLLFIGFLFVLSIVYMRIRFRPRRPEKPLLLSRISDFVKWHLPIVHWFENNYSNLQTVEVLRISLNSGSTINQAIRNTLELDVNCRYRAKLKKWLKLVEAGENPAKSLKRAGLSASLAMAFEQQSNPENTLNVLEMLESVYRTNYSFRVNLARFILLPCTTIMLGGVVAFVAYSIFAAIVKIITVCSSFV